MANNWFYRHLLLIYNRGRIEQIYVESFGLEHHFSFEILGLELVLICDRTIWPKIVPFADPRNEEHPLCQASFHLCLYHGPDNILATRRWSGLSPDWTQLKINCKYCIIQCRLTFHFTRAPLIFNIVTGYEPGLPFGLPWLLHICFDYRIEQLSQRRFKIVIGTWRLRFGQSKTHWICVCICRSETSFF